MLKGCDISSPLAETGTQRTPTGVDVIFADLLQIRSSGCDESRRFMSKLCSVSLSTIEQVSAASLLLMKGGD